MFYSLLSTVIPMATSAVLTYLSFQPYYAQMEYVLYFLCLASALTTLAFTLPFKRLTRLIFALSGALVIINLAYNLIFGIVALALSFITARFMPYPEGKRRILFTQDSALVKVNYRPPSRTRGYFARVSAAAFFASCVLFALTFVFSTPTTIWGIRAFPVDMTEKTLYSDFAVPSGTITCSVGYDSAAIYIDSFSDVESPSGLIASPAKKAGMKPGDVVVKINGQRAKLSDFLTKGPDGSAANFEVLRLKEDGTSEYETFEITPVYSVPDKKYMIGILYYDSILPGIYQTVQTVSFFYPDTGIFAATAHSSEIDDDMTHYTHILKTADVTGRDEFGLTASPGEVLGESYLHSRYGAFGVWAKTDGESLPIARKHDIRLGRATMLSDFASDGVKEYEVYVTGTYRIDERDVICLIVTDERIKKAGGIARGMSGSPIIQHGKIIGALSNTDSRGYISYATFASDMAHEIYLEKDTFNGKEAIQFDS